MREIKFRVWDKVNKIMCEVEGITFNENGNITFLDIWDKKHGYQEAQEIKYFELLRYTGLKDKNGKDIYEGDIVENKNGTKYLIKFDNSMAQFVKEKLNRVFSFGGNSIGTETNLRGIRLNKVIGNKYENGDLL